MTGFEHMPSAGLEPEDVAAMEAESDLPGGWGPEDVRRFDDHKLTRAYPPHSPASIMTTDGFKTARTMPTGPFGLWGEKPSPEARAAYDAKIAAIVVGDLLTEDPPHTDCADPGGVVDDNPARIGLLYRIKSPGLRAAAALGVALMLSLCLVVYLPLMLLAIIGAGLAGLWDGLSYRAVESGRSVAEVARAIWTGAARVWSGR